MHRIHAATARLAPITAMPGRIFNLTQDRDPGRCLSRCASSTLPARFRLV